MLISFRDGILNTDQFDCYHYERISVYINGLMFIRGKKAGRESIDAFVSLYNKSSIFPFDRMHGAFAVLIDMHNGNYAIFTDNSCMHGLFVGSDCIGNDIYEIVGHENKHTLDEMVVCEYLTLTRGFQIKTFISGIRFTDNLKYYFIKSGSCIEKEKGISSIDGPSSIIDPAAFMKDVAYALSDMKCICALTGGFDSRAVAASINKFMHCDCFISGENAHSNEIKAAIRAAQAAGFAMRHVVPQFPSINDEFLRKDFFCKHAYKTRINTGGFRIDFFMKQFAVEGYEALLTGDAGDMHKELWFTQDYPFYWRKKTNCIRFLKTRMEIIDYSQYLGSRMKPIYKEMESQAIKTLDSLVKTRNSQSYLAFGWHVSWVCSMPNHTTATAPITYAPLQELDFVRYSYHLLPKGKRMNSFLRRIITEANPKIARTVTVYGTTASIKWPNMIRDFFAQGIVHAKQALRYVFRKVIRKTLLTESVNKTDLESDIRQTQSANDAVRWAKDEGYISEEASVGTLPYLVLERLLNLYFALLLIREEERKWN